MAADGRNSDKTAEKSAQVRDALDRINARQSGRKVTATSLSLALFGKPDVIRDIFRGHEPPADRWVRIAQALNIPLDVSQIETPTTLTAPPVVVPFDEAMVRDLPLRGIGTSKMKQDGHEETIGYVSRPNALLNRSAAYAAYVMDESNGPVMRPGHILYLDPTMPTKEGDMVRVVLTDRPAVVGILLGSDHTNVTVRCAAETAERRFDAKFVKSVDCVVFHSFIPV